MLWARIAAPTELLACWELFGGLILHSPLSPWAGDTPGMPLALNYEGEEKKLKGFAGSAGVKGKGWWLWLGALRCWLWKGSFSHWDFHHVPTVGASQPRRKGSLQRSSEKEAEQADPCTGLDYGVIHQQVMLWETQPRDSSLTSAHGQPLPAPSPSTQEPGHGFHPGHLALKVRPGQGDIPWSRHGAQLASEKTEMHRWDEQLWTQFLSQHSSSRSSLCISFSEERGCSLEGSCAEGFQEGSGCLSKGEPPPHLL